MNRRDFVRAIPLGAIGSKLALPQGREFRPAPPHTKPEGGRIIDMHVHIFFQDKKPDAPVFTPRGRTSARPDGDVQMNASWDQFKHDMDAVDRAVILHVAREEVGAKGNDEIAAVARRWPGKLIPFGSVNPTFTGALDEFKRSVKDLGFKGCKLSPIYQKFEPMSPGACRIYAKAQEWGVPP